METLVQEVEARTVLGKKVKALRRNGITPANIYGHGIESVAIQGKTDEFEHLLSTAGRTRIITLKSPSFRKNRRVLVKDVQRDPISRKLLHLDFYEISMKEKIKVDVPLTFEGEAPASRRKDLVVLEVLTSIEVECLPTDIPENIKVDLSNLSEAGDHIVAGDLALGDKVTMLTTPDEIVAKVDHAKVAALEEEAAPEEEAEAEAEAAAEAKIEEAEKPSTEDAES